MEVDRLETESGMNLVWLRNAELDVSLPIAIGEFEANAIRTEMGDLTPPRPITHQLFHNTLERLNVRVEQVVITSLVDDIFFARLSIETGGKREQLDARPSDCIALALREGAPVFVKEEVLEIAGIWGTPRLPLPDKPVNKLNKKDLKKFRRWMGFEGQTPSIAYPTSVEKECREKRERWKRRFAGKGSLKPGLLIREEQIKTLKSNARVDSTTRKWLDEMLDRADEVAGLPGDFFETFIPDTGPWNPGGNFCPHCIYKKSPEGINNYFWKWDWKDPDRLECPYCGTEFPNAKYPENGTLHLQRLSKTYAFHITKKELNTPDWRLGDGAERFVNQPIHVSFSGNIRSMKLAWALAQVQTLGIAYSVKRKKSYVKTIERILLRMAEIYPGYPLQSYFQDVVDADPGYATDNADALPTVFKRNACLSVYDGRFGYRHEKTTTQETRVATGLWGSSRIARELTTTGVTFLRLFQGYDLVKSAISPNTRKKIEQDFLLELYLDTRAYDPITNKAGAIRAARVAFGLVYNNKKELQSGLDGYHKILESQFYPDGSMKESPIYGHKPIGEDLWQIPEMLRGTIDLYGKGSLYSAAFQALADISTPLGTHPTLDDSFRHSSTPAQSADIALARCDILIPGPAAPPSEFAMFNTNLKTRTRRPASGKAHNHYYEGRHLACLGYGSGKNRTQLYLLGEDGLRGHRHAGALATQLYAGGREIFPDLGYICDHPGNAWVKATPSHQTVTIDGRNSYPDGPGQLLGFDCGGKDKFVDIQVQLKEDRRIRRALTLLRKSDGLPILLDIFDVEGGNIHDYNSRVLAPPGSLSIPGATLKPRRGSLYEEHSFYPLLDFQSAGKMSGGWDATWGKGKEKVRATILSDCSELITYRSPGWRSQFEITDDPKQYFDTLVLRNRRKKSRFIVVYEVLSGKPEIISGEVIQAGKAIEVSLQLTRNRSLRIETPGSHLENSQTEWSVRRT